AMERPTERAPLVVPADPVPLRSAPGPAPPTDAYAVAPLARQALPVAAVLAIVAMVFVRRVRTRILFAAISAALVAASALVSRSEPTPPGR
ncbi:MAG: hypothetical protein M3144_05175, partial [Actinomycetota bacterium]|nr:hypothetical protein [Actinomycetota bacterium]